MTNAEIIKALRYCKECEVCNKDSSAECPYEHHWTDGEDCQRLLLADAADALEAANKRIEELEDDLRNSTISKPERIKIYECRLICVVIAKSLLTDSPVKKRERMVGNVPSKAFCPMSMGI